MPSAGQSSHDELTVIVFKDNYAARTFRVPLSWISRMGSWLGLIAAIALISSVAATKYYRLARIGSPARVNELEEELSGLRASYGTLQAKFVTAETARAVPETSGPNVPNTAHPAPPPAVSTPAIPPPFEKSSGPALLFQDLPAGIDARPSHESAKGSVTLALQRMHWRGNILDLQAALQYTRTDGGNQQGLIVILSRGPETLLAYPEGVLNPGSAATLIAPERGEYFSVSRYREVKASFGPVRNPSALNELEILIFGARDDRPSTLLIRLKSPVNATTAPRIRPARPAPESGSETEHDVDDAPEPATPVTPTSTNPATPAAAAPAEIGTPAAVPTPPTGSIEDPGTP